MASKTPSEIARETLKLLAERRLWPTPENYQALYNEIAGQPKKSLDFPQDRLQNIIHVLPAQTPVQQRLLQQLRKAVTDKDWAALQAVWVGYANLGLSDRVLTNEPKPAALLPVVVAAAPQPPAPSPPTEVVAPELARQIVLLAQQLHPIAQEDESNTQVLFERLVAYFSQEVVELTEAVVLLKNFGFRLSFLLQDQSDIRLALLHLIRLGLENIAILNIDDAWLQGQLESLQAVATPPLSLRRLEELQSRLEEVIFKQAEAKHKLLQAQAHMKELLAAFIERLAQMDDSSSHYQDELEHYASKVQTVQSLHELTPLLEEVMAATRVMSDSNQQVRSELQTLRQRSDATQEEISQLRQELERTSALARHDVLTGALNRKGLDEAMERATERAALLDTPLCLALLDLDNFKALNDRLGHSTGDRALQHLVEVTRQVMRGQDQLARYGGEEFVVLLPQTSLEQGVEVMRRLQRELTKRYFLEGNERILITFSAGVTQVQEGESHEQALHRADQAMYQAKRAGKNRVVAI